MKCTKDFERLDFPENFKFGIEIEAYNVKTRGKNGLYTGKSAEYIKSQNWHMATSKEEVLVSKGGAELVSPILRDTEQDWKAIAYICEHIKKYPGNKGSEVVADNKCGLHVHFDAECLTSNPNIFRNFMKIYAESEELLYKMCNDVNDPIRKGAINRDLKGIHLISAMWRKGMAAPSGKKILKKIQNNTLKVSFKKFGRLRMLISKYKLDERRYSGLNLTNIGNSKKNTIEFRMANGTLNPEVIKQTVFLYASLINTAIQSTNKPQEFQEKLDTFYRTDVTEKEKAISFLNLIMSDSQDKQIYMDRWQSVKDASVFSKNTKKGFAQNRFTREQFKNIATRTPADRIKHAFNFIKQKMLKTKEYEEMIYD